MNIRPLTKNDVQVRVQNINAKNEGLFLIYKDARVDMRILNELYPLKWKREHKAIGNEIVCRVSIYNNDIKDWVYYEDTGSAGNFEKNKSLYSDSFKRACFNIGIGIELYTAPVILIQLYNNDYYTDKNNKKVFSNIFSVSEYEVENGTITKLEIIDKNNNVRFQYPKTDYKADTKQAIEPKQQQPKPNNITESDFNKYYLNPNITCFETGKYANIPLHTLSIDVLEKQKDNIVKYLNTNNTDTNLKTKLAVLIKTIDKILEVKKGA